MNDLKKKILDLAASDLAEIETALKENIKTYLDILSKVAGHILFSGGKRIRPLLMILSARICGYKGTYDKTFSVIFEYLHTATLLHDDIVDEASIRRGRPVANTIYGSATAVLVGDFLLARSRDRKFIDQVGTYDPKKDPAEVRFKEEKAIPWLRKGVQPTPTVRQLLIRSGISKKLTEEKTK